MLKFKMITCIILLSCEKHENDIQSFKNAIDRNDDKTASEFIVEKIQKKSEMCGDLANDSILDLVHNWLNEIVGNHKKTIKFKRIRYSSEDILYIIIPEKIKLYTISAGENPDMQFGYNINDTSDIILSCLKSVVVEGMLINIITLDTMEYSVLNKYSIDQGCLVDNNICLQSKQIKNLTKYIDVTSKHGRHGLEFYSFPKIKYISHLKNTEAERYFVMFDINSSIIDLNSEFIKSKSSYKSLRVFDGIVL